MSYNPENQYRCTIIRGKAQNKLDSLLPLYAGIIQEICPCGEEEFDRLFNERLQSFVPGGKKTLNNHRTEIAHKLFGMYFVDPSGVVYPSERTLHFLEQRDQPQFFKDICFKFQFPNGMDKPQTLQERKAKRISIRQFVFIIQLLALAEEQGVRLSKNELGYFVLNNLDVLRGAASPRLVLDAIREYRKARRPVKVRHLGRASSYSMQHINEQINLLKLANLIRVSNGGSDIHLNPNEKTAIKYFINEDPAKLSFDVYGYDLSAPEGRNQLYQDWQEYFANVDKGGLDAFPTSVEAIRFNVDSSPAETAIPTDDTVALGDEGEQFVYAYEQERVGKFDRRLTNKIHLLGKTRGLGYDIQSIFADGSDKSEFVHYIEVKATKRVTAPEREEDGWLDTISLTRNEWVAAEQHSDSFSIYRVYFTPDKTIVYVIRNPYSKNETEALRCVPTNYRLDFSKHSIDQVIEKEVGSSD